MIRLILPLFCLITVTVKAQDARDRGEFSSYPNGLMYSEANMAALRFVVDSLNLRFKNCENKPFYSCTQARMKKLVFKSKTDNLLAIRDKIKTNPDFEALAKEYKSVLDQKKTNLIAIQQKSEDGKVYFLSGSPEEGYDSDYYLNEKYTGRKDLNPWLTDYEKPDKYTKYYELTCYYFPQQWETIKLPASLASIYSMWIA